MQHHVPVMLPKMRAAIEDAEDAHPPGLSTFSAFASFTSATMPAFTSTGSIGHAAMIRAKPASAASTPR